MTQTIEQQLQGVQRQLVHQACELTSTQTALIALMQLLEDKGLFRQNLLIVQFENYRRSAIEHGNAELADVYDYIVQVLLGIHQGRVDALEPGQ
ncbi:hypothetical protein [Bowmanella dokdonensis]|uniref:Uncharacterized protein n=1 Tax=Bowmanella dokdonensis TaxID=751969 RepID=A0A939IQT4_9ALTE|nr:hypothetical protein [Bowmanella dokdonensis]MBN7824761.1 hypothetical protein [Bowmanella dokdonensis]